MFFIEGQELSALCLSLSAWTSNDTLDSSQDITPKRREMKPSKKYVHWIYNY